MVYNDGMNKKKKNSSETFSSTIGNYFDENGVLCYDRLTNDLRKIYDQVRSNTRKTQ